MKYKYVVAIVEMLAMTVEIEATSAEEAVNQVKSKYWNEEIIVESSKWPDAEVSVSLVE